MPIFAGWIFVWILCAFFCVGIALGRGNGAVSGFLWGFMLGPIGVVAVSVMPGGPSAGTATVAIKSKVKPGPKRQCPICRSRIAAVDRVCVYCHQESPPTMRS
jgi:hypothetical protein